MRYFSSKLQTLMFLSLSLKQLLSYWTKVSFPGVQIHKYNIQLCSHMYSNYAIFLCVNLATFLCTHFADHLYPFGDAVGDAAVPSGIVADTTSPPLTLSPTFRFFGIDEDTIHVGYTKNRCMTCCLAFMLQQI